MGFRRSSQPRWPSALALSALAVARDFPEVTSGVLQLPSKHTTKICKANWFLILRDDKQQKTSMISVITVYTKFSIYSKACVVELLSFGTGISFQPLNWISESCEWLETNRVETGNSYDSNNKKLHLKNTDFSVADTRIWVWSHHIINSFLCSWEMLQSYCINIYFYTIKWNILQITLPFSFDVAQRL